MSETRRKTRVALISAALGLAFAGAGTAQAATVTYGPTGVEETFTVPDGVVGLHVVAIGAHAGAVGFPLSDGGFGARAEADILVTPGQILIITVGGGGGGACCGGGGGFNGGGSGFNGGGGPYPAGGGGGASDVRTLRRGFGAASLQSRLIVAGGGGGGATSSTGQRGGDGGDAGVGGGAGVGSYAGGGGSAGTPTAGGAGGCGAYGGCYPAGSAGFLGSGGNSGSYTGSAGGGGGGVFGGGGGAAGASSAIAEGGGGGGGGGGGSSGFGETATNTSVTADRTGSSLIAISYKIGGGNASKSGLSFGKVKLNKSRGTAILPVTVPGSGTLSIGGKGVIKKRPGLAHAITALAKAAPQAGTYQLKVKAKGPKKAKLFATGKAKVNAVVTFKPTSGDAVHDSKTIRLRKN